MGESTLNVYILFRSLSPPNNVEPKAYLSKLRCIEKFTRYRFLQNWVFFSFYNGNARALIDPLLATMALKTVRKMSLSSFNLNSTYSFTCIM